MKRSTVARHPDTPCYHGGSFTTDHLPMGSELSHDRFCGIAEEIADPTADSSDDVTNLGVTLRVHVDSDLYLVHMGCRIIVGVTVSKRKTS